jgi:hypothetical protein
MTYLRRLVFAVLVSSFATGQTNQPQSNSSDGGTAGEIEQLEKTLSDQQKDLAEQQRQMVEQQREIERLRQTIDSTKSIAVAIGTSYGSPRLVPARLDVPESNSAPAVSPVDAPQETPGKESPLSFRIGAADFTPGGFMDFTSIFRTTNTGNQGGTLFYSIPFANTTAGNISEVRLTAQNSRLSVKAHDQFGKNDVTGYVEVDFLGNDATNVEITTNSHTLRERLYFIDYKRDKWEMLAGQAWGWLTPNRVGVSPMPVDEFYSLNEDFNFQVGLTWTRAPQFRVAYHPTEKWALGVALENPEQFGGQGEVTFPAAFNSQLAGEIDEGAGNTIPNLHPDVIPKIAYDTTTAGGKHMHAEVAGLVSSMRVTDLPTVTDAVFVKHTKTGGGVSAALNLEFLKNIRFVTNGFWSDGGGRYIFGMAPDLVVLPVNAPGNTCTIVGTTTKTAAGCDVDISLVHSGSGIAGVEAQVTRHTMLFTYYGAMYAQRDYSLDTTSTATTQPFVGFGGPSSANSNNRAVQEPTFGWIQTFWKNPQYGALQFISQASYLTRSPWFVATGAPKNAHLTMVWLDLRYVLP